MSQFAQMDITQQGPAGLLETLLVLQNSRSDTLSVEIDSGFTASAVSQDLFTPEEDVTVNGNTLPWNTDHGNNHSEEGAVGEGFFEVEHPSSEPAESGVISLSDIEQDAAGASTAALAMNEASMSDPAPPDDEPPDDEPPDPVPPDHVPPLEERGGHELNIELEVFGYGIPLRTDMDVNEPCVDLASERMCSSIYFKNCGTCFKNPRGTISYPCHCFCNCTDCAPFMRICALCQRMVRDFVPAYRVD